MAALQTTERVTELGTLLRRFRRTAGLTQQELAERAQISVRAVGDLERGVRRIPHKDTVTLLAEALGLNMEDSVLLHEAARASRWPERAVHPTPPGAQSAPLPTTIHGPLTPLIGRQQEREEIVRLLEQPDVRLLTLIGPAGIGKTRLAQQMVDDLQGICADGVVFISLVPVSDSAFVLSAIAQALDVREEAGKPRIEQIQERLANKQVLLILDNFEHVADAAPDIAAALSDCQGVKALVTSRAPLHVRGEREFAVPPLDTPDLSQLPALPDLARYAAVALFVQRAQAVRASFALTPEIARTVAAITVRLDGLPLALELAAARCKALSPQALLTRLEASLALLTHGALDLPPRQQTMRNALDWSHDLLDEMEQRLFRRLAVFVGGWTLEASESVCADDPEATPNILDLLTALIDKSLVAAEVNAEGETRFHLLQLIREYALERLTAANERQLASQRHAEYYLAFAEAAQSKLFGRDQAVWFARLALEHDNLRAALAWAQHSGEIELGLRLAAKLWWFWQVRGFSQEGRAWLHNLLALQPEPQNEQQMAVRAEALRAAGNLAWDQSDYETGEKLLEEALSLYQHIGDTFGEAHSLNTLGLIADERGQREIAIKLFEEALALFEKRSEILYEAMVYGNLATVCTRKQEYEKAIELYEKSLELVRQVGDKRLIASTLGNLGYARHKSGDLARAAQLMGASLELFEELGDRDDMAYMLNNLGDLQREQGHLKVAFQLLRRSFAFARETGVQREMCNILDSIAELANDLGAHRQAIRFFALSSKERARLQAPRHDEGQRSYAAQVTLAQAKLGEAAFLAAEESGRVMTWEEVEAVLAGLEDAVVEHQ